MTLGILGSMPTHLISPWAGKQTATAIWFSRVCGVLVLLFLPGLIRYWWHARHERRGMLVVIGVILFTIGNAVVIGLARGWLATTEFEYWGLATRYRIFSILLWAALLCAFLQILASRLSSKHQRRLLLATALVIPVLLLPSQLRDFMQVGLKGKRVQEAALTLVTEAYNKKPIILQFWFLDPSLPVEFSSYMRKHDLAIFRFGWTHWEGTKLPGAGRLHKRVQGGVVDAGRKDRGWWLKGWIGHAHPGALIVGVDRAERIRAIAQLTRRLPSRPAGRTAPQPWWLALLQGMNPDLPAILGWGRGWYGYAPKSAHPKKLRYYLVNSEKQII